MEKQGRRIIGSIILFFSIWFLLMFGNKPFFSFSFNWNVIFLILSACGFVMIIVGKIEEDKDEKSEIKEEIKEEILEEIKEEIRDEVREEMAEKDKR